ncbi:MAG: hypothetical protein KDE33_05650 [Bacteroidetes bacterium]|nr:hypothetical protein [Bacteroidota bacterium]
MDEIKEVVQFLSKKKLRRIETLNLEEEGDSVYRDFYYILLNEPNISEEELAKKIANTSKEDKKYGMIKSRFKKRLFNHALFLELSENSTKQALEISNAYRSIYTSVLFRGNNIRKASYYIVNKTLKVIEKYELLDLLIIAYQIKLNESNFYNKPKKLNEYADKLLYYSKALSNYSNCLVIYEKASLILSKSKVLNQADLEKLNALIQDSLTVSELPEATFETKWTMFNFKMNYYEYIGDYQSIEKQITYFEKIFLKKPILFYKTRKLLLYSWKLDAFGYLKIRKGAKSLINYLHDLYEPNSMGWYYIQRKILYYYMHTEQYVFAIDISHNVIESKKMTELNIKLQEMWLLWHTYLQILNANYNQEKLATIKLAKILNSVPQISKDKLGLNTLVRTLEIIYRYLIYDDENLIETYNALLIYKSRYLKPNKLRRAQIFFDMITATSKRGFTNETTKREGEKALKRYERLKNDNPERKAYEFIPYEKLIEVMMGRPAGN